MLVRVQHSCVTCGKLEQYTKQATKHITIGCPRCGQEVQIKLPPPGITVRKMIYLDDNLSMMTFFTQVTVEE